MKAALVAAALAVLMSLSGCETAYDCFDTVDAGRVCVKRAETTPDLPDDGLLDIPNVFGGYGKLISQE